MHRLQPRTRKLHRLPQTKDRVFGERGEDALGPGWSLGMVDALTGDPLVTRPMPELKGMEKNRKIPMPCR